MKPSGSDELISQKLRKAMPIKSTKSIPEDEGEDVGGIFDKMVEELPQEDVGELDEPEIKKHGGKDNTRIHIKRKKKAKAAKQARKKQQKK